MPRPPAPRLLAPLVAAALGCATTGERLALTPAALRAEVARRAPEIGADVVVPYELPAGAAARARAIVADRRSDLERARALVAALFAPDGFHLRYAADATGTAAETLRRGEGNCLALASVFVGLARAVGLRALYMDASVEVHETRLDGAGVAVTSGHLTAMVTTADGDLGLDVERLGRIRSYRVIGDLEALANFYNNRGFERVDEAGAGATAADWEGAARDFRRAIAVLPTFARAWNDLGIASARLGRPAEAAAAYRAAIAADPSMAAPYNNLGALELAAGELPAALGDLAVAAHLEPRGAHVQLNLGLARARAGDRPGARAALRRALELRPGFREAQAELDRLAGAGPQVEEPPAPPLPAPRR